jgi:hypothetical protein
VLSGLPDQARVVAQAGCTFHLGIQTVAYSLSTQELFPQHMIQRPSVRYPCPARARRATHRLLQPAPNPQTFFCRSRKRTEPRLCGRYEIYDSRHSSEHEPGGSLSKWNVILRHSPRIARLCSISACFKWTVNPPNQSLVGYDRHSSVVE